MDEIGERIRQLREENNLTQADLALAFDMTDKGVSSWERNGIKSKQLLKKVAQYFSVSVDWLKTGQTERPGASFTTINKGNTIGRDQVNKSADQIFEEGMQAGLDDWRHKYELLKKDNERLEAMLKLKDEMIEMLKRK